MLSFQLIHELQNHPLSSYLRAPTLSNRQESSYNIGFSSIFSKREIANAIFTLKVINNKTFNYALVKNLFKINLAEYELFQISRIIIIVVGTYFLPW